MSRSNGTVTYARYDWWGHPTAPPDTFAYHGTPQEAYLSVDPKLTSPPAAAPGAAPLASPPAVPADTGGDPFTEAASLALRGDGTRGVDLLASAMAQRPGTTEAATAFTVAGALASGWTDDRETQSAALDLLRRESRGARAEHRSWARRGLVRAYGRAGDRRRMMAEAEALATAAADPVSAFVGHLTLAYGHAEASAAAEAWAAWDAAAALGASAEVGDGVSVEAARQDLVALVGERAPAGRLAAAPVGMVATEQGVGLGAPYPNPAGPGAVTVPFVLAERVVVRLAVVDVLGREVVVLVNGEHTAGAYEARLDVGRLAPGTYVVRLTTGSAGDSARVLTVTR